MYREDYDFEMGGRREREREKEREKPKFPDLLRDTLKKIEDVIMVSNNSSIVDLDVLIDILSDTH